jgi:malate synthase
LEDERPLTPELLEALIERELQFLRADLGDEAFDEGLFVTAAQLFLDSALAPDFEDFPGTPAKKLLD